MWVDFFYWTFLLAYAVIVFSTMWVVVLENRQPAKTIAWLVVLAFIPIVGLVVFYFFGQSLRKERFINRRTYNVLTHNMLLEQQSQPLPEVPEKYERLVNLMLRKNHAVATNANRVEVLNSGRDYLQALLRDIHSARHHIHIETYIIEDDAVGRLLRDALIDKVREGVEVRFLYDDVGCWNVSDKFFDNFAQGGIDIHPFLPVRFPSLTHKVNYRNHRKLCVIDGMVGYIGGMNFALRYVSERMPHWRDMQLRLKGQAVGSLQRIFLIDWCYVTGKELLHRKFFPSVAQETKERRKALLQIVCSYPVSEYPELMYGITCAIQHARKYLYIQTPYFLPTEPVLQALQSAAMSGVDVRLMLPKKTDSFWLRWGNDSFLMDVLKAGVRVYHYEGGFLHTKALVADDDWCSVGSANMDFRSFDNNFEANAFVYEPTVAKQVKAEFLKDLADSKEVLPEKWKARSYGHRLMESSTRLLSPLL